MNFLSNYYRRLDSHQLQVSGPQGSAFAKEVADDFNPIHDAGSKRFCVPGDLLFSLALNEYGLYQKMEVSFLDLVNADSVLSYPPLIDGEQSVQIVGDRGRPMLDIGYHGDCSTDQAQIESMVRSYVAFSGHNFPDILVPLMQEHNVMINPNRPLVIYKSMSFELEHVDFKTVDIELGETELSVDGKRGSTQLNFTMNSEGQYIGHGSKHLVMSGLREYNEQVVQDMCDTYLASKQAF